MIDALKKIWLFAGNEKGNINKSVFLGFFYALFHMLQIGAIYYVLKGITEKSSSASIAVVSGGLLILSILGRTVIGYFSQLQRTHAGYFMVADKRISIGNKLKSVPMGYFSQHPIGEITGIVTTVLDEVENTAPMVLVSMLSGLINALVFTVMILFYRWEIGLFVLAGTALYLWITSAMETRSRDLAPRRQAAQANLVEAVLEQLQGMHIVKAFNLTGRGDKKVRAALETSCESNLKIEKLFTPYTIGQEMALRFFSVGILAYSLSAYFRGSMNLLTALMSVIIAFTAFSQVESAGIGMAILRVVTSSIDDANQVDLVPMLDLNGRALIPATHEIEFKDVSFSYDKKKILDGVSLTIPEKTLTAIVGPSGAGKTTLCLLLTRFWDIDSGQITIGGTDIRDFTLTALMNQVSMVFQQVYLFQDTIENNIKFGAPNASHAEVVEAAKKASCHDFIMLLPDQYQTVVGEGGANLSGGEKQRIAIARAILKDAPIIIFDEATANVDPENEDQLQKAIEALTENKTVIMIAHRLNTVRNANQIVVVANGKIDQLGTHAQLISQDGIYKRFVADRENALRWKIEKQV